MGTIHHLHRPFVIAGTAHTNTHPAREASTPPASPVNLHDSFADDSECVADLSPGQAIAMAAIFWLHDNLVAIAFGLALGMMLTVGVADLLVWSGMVK